MKKNSKVDSKTIKESNQNLSDGAGEHHQVDKHMHYGSAKS